MATSQPTAAATAATGGKDHHADSSTADELVLTPAFDGASTREVVWFGNMKALYYAQVYQLHEVTAFSLKKDEPTQVVQEGPDGRNSTLYFHFEHPDESKRFGQFSTEANVYTGPHRDQLLALSPPKHTKFTADMLVLAKGEDHYFYPAELFKIEPRRNRETRYHVRFLARDFEHLEYDHVVGKHGLVPLSSESGLRVGGSQKTGYWAYLPSNEELKDPPNLGDLKPSARKESTDGQAPTLKTRGAKKGDLKANKVVKKKSTKKGGKKGSKKGAETDV